MSFWKENNIDPSRKFRFQIIGGDQWHWVTSVDKPSYEVNTNEYLLTNHKFKYPGVLTWNDITITMVDSGAIVSKVENYLANAGYNVPKEDPISGIAKNGYDGEGGVLQIQQLNSKGEPVEDWHLYGAFIKSANYGSLEYSSDELVEVQMVLSYDYATITAESE